MNYFIFVVLHLQGFARIYFPRNGGKSIKHRPNQLILPYIGAMFLEGDKTNKHSSIK